jgi:hypothetical protein
MAVEAEARVHDLEVAEKELDGALRRACRRRRLLHLHRVSALVAAGPAERIAERSGEAERRAREPCSDGRPPARVNRRARLDRRAGHDTLDVDPELPKLLLVDDALDDVEARAPVGLEDVAMH